METNIWNFDDSSTFPGVPRCPTKNLGLIGSAVSTFIGYKQTNRQTDRQTDKPNLYIDVIIVNHAFSLDRGLFCIVSYWSQKKSPRK